MLSTQKHYILLFFVVAVGFVLPACKQNNGLRGRELEINALDSLVEITHAMIDTGYKSNYGPLKKHLTELEKKCIETGNKEGQARVYLMRGSMERWRQNYLEGLNWCHKAYEVIKSSGTSSELDVMLEIGDIYRDLNKKRLANEFYLLAYDFAKVHSDFLTQAFVTNRLGTIFYAQHDYNLALENFKYTLQAIKPTNFEGEHNTKWVQVYNNIGLCYVQKGFYDSAMMYYDSALDRTQTLDTKIKENAYGVVSGNIGRLFQLKGEYEAAVERLHTNIAINSRPNFDNGDAVTSYTYLLEIYNQLDSVTAFETNINKAIDFTFKVKQSRMKEWRARLYGLMSAFQAKRGNYKGAHLFQSQQMALVDSITKINEAENLQDMILFRELNEKTKMVELLEEDNESNKLRLQTFIVISVLVVVILVIVVFFMNVYRKNLKEQKKLNERVALQNEQITLNTIDLEQAIEEMKLLNSEKNRMLGMVAHDLRGPIYNITGVLQLLEGSESFAQMNEADVQLVELIKRSCENALDVINDLLDAAHLDNGGLEIEKSNQQLAEVIRSTVRLYENRAHQKQITIEFNEPAEAVTAFVSKEKMTRAVGNLLSNAIKFSHSGSTIRIVLSEVNGHALVSIADEGMGIPEKLRNAIYDKFTMAKRHGTEGEKPVGLGMSIVKQIVDAHNGRLWFDTEVNRGTTFYIEIPLKG